MDISSGKQALLEMTIECPKYKAACLSITLDMCRMCTHHKGVEKLTEIKGVEIFDVLCVYPFRRRVTRLIREMKGDENGSTE